MAGESSKSASVVTSAPGSGDPDEKLDNVLDRLPSLHRLRIEEQYDIPEVKVTLFSILRYATWLDTVMQVVGTIMAIAAGVALPFMTILLGDLTNVFGGFSSPGSPNLQPISKLALDLVYIGLGVFAATYISTALWIISGERISRRLREEYLRSVLRQNIAFFDRLGAGEVQNRIGHDVDLIQDGIGDKVALTINGVATFFSAFAIAFSRQWKFTLILFCIFPTLVLIFVLGGRSVAKTSKEIVTKFNKAATVAEEVLTSVRTTQAFAAYVPLSQLYDNSLVDAQRIAYRKSIYAAFMFASIFLSLYLVYGLAFWEGSRLIANNEINVGRVMTVLFAVIIGSFSIGQIAPRVESFSKAVAAGSKIFQTIKRVPIIDSLDESGRRLENVRGELELKNITFIYPSRPEVTVLKNISLHIPAGKFTAVVGASGSGKSTIIQLLERFYDPVEGEVSLDGVDIKTLNLGSVRGVMSLVAQEPVLFNTSILKNVSHGLIGTPLEHAPEEQQRKAIEEACVLANADSFIKNLPMGYDTFVGERGFLLSGGQKQRIAIARAIVGDPKVLLLDEATSALDTSNERIVQEALDVAAKSRTTLCIAHRLSTIKNADNIVVISRGEVVEQGTHEDLIARGGVYHGLVEAQRISSQRRGELTEHFEENEKADEELNKGLSQWESHNSHDDEKKEDDESIKAERRASLGILSTKRTSILSTKKTSLLNAKRTSFLSTKRASVNTDYENGDQQGTLEPGVILKTHYTLLQLFKKTLAWNRKERYLIASAWASSLVTGGAYPAQALLYGYLIAALISPDTDYLRRRANFLSVWWIVLAVFEFAAYYLQTWGFGYSSEKMARRVRLESFRSMLRQDIAFFDRDEHSTGTLANMLSQEATAMAGLSGVNLGAILTLIVNLVSGIILSICYGWKLGLVSTSLLPILVTAGYFRFSLMNRLSFKLREAYEKTASLTTEQVAAIKTVASLRREKSLHQEFVVSLNEPVKAALVGTLKSTFFYAFSTSLGFFTNALVFWYGSRLLRQGEMSITAFFVCFMALAVGSQSAGHFFSFAPDITKAYTSTINVTRLMEHTPIIDPWAEQGQKIDILPKGHLIFRDVHFRYPTRPHVPVLRGLNIEVKPGQYIALVGSSGCGKSTTVALVERFYDPIFGEIIVDGLAIDKYNLNDYRRNIALVGQEPTLYQGSIKFNILLGATAENVSQEELDQAAKDANIYDFVQSLPEGYETVVGTKGSALSGGQKQRIAIARALIRNPKILLLDEATSALDSESEKVVQEALDKAAKGRTTIAIAHRLSTIQKANVIYVIERGVVVEKGTHDELNNLGGRYYELAKQQELEKKEKGEL